MPKRDWTSEPPIVTEAAVPALIRKVLDSLHHIKEHTAAMALSLERIEEMAAEERSHRHAAKTDRPDPHHELEFYPTELD